MKKLISALLVLVLALSCLAGCAQELPGGTTPAPTDPAPTNPGETTPAETPAPVEELTYADGTILRMATGYNKPDTGLFFDAGTVGEGVTLSNGVTYHTDDLKPTWVEVEKRLNIKFENKWTGAGSAANEFKYWQERLAEVDMVSGSATLLTENGEAGKVVNIGEYLDQMPNFKAYLEANPIVRLSITGNVDTGAIYFAPYFDGVNDIERMPLMRTDWIVKLLNGEGEFTADKCNTLKAAVYQPYMPTSGKIDIEVVKADGSATETISKDYDKAGNIIATMNAAGTIDGVAAVNMLRKYIDEAYNGYYGTNRADLFMGQNAAWDADELVALLRCVVANPQSLNGTDVVYGLFARENGNNQRRVDLIRLAGVLFGVRGLESRQDYLYVGNDGKLHDARQEADTYEALLRMNALAQEGLIGDCFMKNDKDAKTANILENDLGFMHYDYNQTQTVFNNTKLQEGEKYMAVMVPVARWDDGTGEQFIRFTESWRSVKTDGWAISKAGVEGNEDKLNAALKLIDYAYSPEGQILMSYGPDEFIKTKADGSYETFIFNGEAMPVIADGTKEDLWKLEDGNYTNFARRYLGSTLSFVKSQAFEYQCTTDVGIEGAAKISKAIELGTIKHPLLTLADNAWYTSVPTILPHTAAENEQIAQYKELKDNFSTSSGDKINNLVDIIVEGYAAFDGVASAEDAIKLVSESWNGSKYLGLKNEAYVYLVEYFEALNK